MKKMNLVLKGILVIVVVGSIYIFLNTSRENKKMMPSGNANKDLMMKKEDTMMKSDEKTMMTPSIQSRYIPYSSETFNTSANTKRILFFYANWCPTCVPADKNFVQNMNLIPESVTLIRVNYNDPDTDQEEKELAKKYGITYQHTFVQIDSKGNEVTKWNGGQIEELLKNIK